MRNVHEAVVRNRLEQLRKRQRDEAMLAQQELLAGVAMSTLANTEAISSTVDSVASPKKAEPYDRSMSPEPLDITKLSREERDIDIISAEDDLKALVSFNSSPSFFNY